MHNSYDKNISKNEFIRYKADHVYVCIGNNYLNSYLDMFPLVFEFDKWYYLLVEKTDTEKRLKEPYSRCRDSPDEKYCQLNCIEDCINRGIKNKYNCSISGFYTIEGLKRCLSDINSKADYNANLIKVSDYFGEFRDECDKSCPKECESIKDAIIWYKRRFWFN